MRKRVQCCVRTAEAVRVALAVLCWALSLKVLIREDLRVHSTFNHFWAREEEEPDPPVSFCITAGKQPKYGTNL